MERRRRLRMKAIVEDKQLLIVVERMCKNGSVNVMELTWPRMMGMRMRQSTYSVGVVLSEEDCTLKGDNGSHAA